MCCWYLSAESWYGQLYSLQQWVGCYFVWSQGMLGVPTWNLLRDGNSRLHRVPYRVRQLITRVYSPLCQGMCGQHSIVEPIGDTLNMNVCPATLRTKSGVAGALSCVPCGNGTFSNVTGAIKCHEVPPGHVWVNASRSKPCPKGSYGLGGDSPCQACQPGSQANEDVCSSYFRNHMY